MTITAEELATRPMTTQVVPLVDDNRPEVFGVMLRFINGSNRCWYIVAPKTPIDENWVREAVRSMIERMVAELRDGKGEPQYKRDSQAFRETNWSSLTGALRHAVWEWEHKRRVWYRQLAGRPN